MDNQSIILLINLVVLLVAPYLPDIVFNAFVETYFGAILLLFSVLYSITFGYLSTIATFTSVASLFAESHSRKARKVKKMLSDTAAINNEVNYKNQLAPSPKIVPSEVHPDDATPEHDDAEKHVTFMPKDGDGYNEFKPVDASINEKEPLSTTSLSKDAAAVYEENHLAEKEII